VRRNKISFVGAGNVAGSLCFELHKRNYIIEHIVSRNPENGRILAGLCNATWSDDYVIPETSRIIIVAVPDHALAEVLEKITCSNSAVIAHTAGSIGLDIFPSRLVKKGVLYPLQTFSSGRKPDMTNVPVFIEASDENTLGILKKLAESFSRSVFLSDTEHRKLLHLAAVFVCNFTNHMLTRGKEISAIAGFPFEILKPLIVETVEKAIEMGPENSQTGPAIRKDLNTIEKHMDLLSFSPELKTIYDLLSKSITGYNKTI
jgi:predicted short-subunit dehydrogenase-like oxidoreductase (DUF2520 family)